MKNDELEKVEDSTLAGLKEMGAFGLQVNLGVQYMFLHSYILAFRCRPIKKLDKAKNSMTLYCPLLHFTVHYPQIEEGVSPLPLPPPPPPPPTSPLATKKMKRKIAQ